MADGRLIVATMLCLALLPAAHAQPLYSGTDASGALWLSDTAQRGLQPLFAPVDHRPLVLATARRHGVDPALVRAVITVESAWNPAARSPKGAAGLMQLMPVTAARYGVLDPLDPAQNVDGGVRYLRDLLEHFGGDLPLALAAYNAGEGAVERHGRRIPPYKESERYVHRVTVLFRSLRHPASP